MDKENVIYIMYVHYTHKYKYTNIYMYTHTYIQWGIMQLKEKWNYIFCRKIDVIEDHHSEQCKPTSKGQIS
jgi:hypothetical protein